MFEAFRSVLFATTTTGMFLASRLPRIVMLTCVYGSLVESMTASTTSMSSNHLIASMIPFVASLALFLASFFFTPYLRNSSKSTLVLMPGVSIKLISNFLPSFSITTFSLMFTSRVSCGTLLTTPISSPVHSLLTQLAMLVLPAFGGP